MRHCRVSLPAGLDHGDGQRGAGLRMPVLAAVVGPPLLLEDEHLVAADLLDGLGRDGGAAGAALGIGALADHEHAVESPLCPRLAGELLGGNEVVLGNLVLLAAGTDDCEHDGRFALKIDRTGSPVRGWGTIARASALSRLACRERAANLAARGGCERAAVWLISAPFRRGRVGQSPAPFIPQSRYGEVPEWSIGAVSKTVRPLAGSRGFESLPLRQFNALILNSYSLFRRTRKRPHFAGYFELAVGA